MWPAFGTVKNHQGVKVVDLWAGEKDLGKTWEKDTIVNVFSVGKGTAALGIALLHSRGLLDYDAKVSNYWHAFGCNGKENISFYREGGSFHMGWSIGSVEVPVF